MSVKSPPNTTTTTSLRLRDTENTFPTLSRGTLSKNVHCTFSGSDLRQCGCCDALANGLEMVVCCVKCNFRKIRKLFFQDFIRGLEHDVTAVAFAYTPEDHDVFNFVSSRHLFVAILRKPIAQVDTTSFVQISSLFRIVLHRLLN